MKYPMYELPALGYVDQLQASGFLLPLDDECPLVCEKKINTNIFKIIIRLMAVQDSKVSVMFQNRVIVLLMSLGHISKNRVTRGRVYLFSNSL